MNQHKKLWVYISVYATVCLALFMVLDISISNGYARSVSAAYIAESISSGQLSVQHFIDGEQRYKIFSGIADWPPLQLILLTISFLIFGINKFAYTIVPLLITIACLVYVYFLTLLAYKDKKTALQATVLTSLCTLFFYESASPMLENGLALFTIAALYHFARWFDQDDTKHFYIFCTSLGLGLLYKLPMILIVPSLIIGAYLYVGKTIFTYWKQGIIGILLIGVMLSPMIVRDITLNKYGVEQTTQRNLGRLHYLAPQEANLTGFLTAQELEFQNGLSDADKALVDHRYELSYAQKGFITFTSLFYDLLLLAPIFALLFVKKKFNEIEIMLTAFIIVNIIFYTLHGLIPRYMIPATVCVAIIAASALKKVPREAEQYIFVLTVIGLLASNIVFMYGVANNKHVLSKQYDYDGTVQEILSTTTGNFTIHTFRPYQMSFYSLKYDTQRRGRIDFIDGNKAWNDSFIYEVTE